MAKGMANLEEAFIDELKDLLHAERQITKALPRMAKKAENPELRKAFEEHLKVTEEQISRLEQVFELLGKPARAKKCDGMEGIIGEGKEVMQEAEEDVVDAVLIAAAQKVEHYEIASYGTVCTWADDLGCEKKVIDLLKRTLSEEKETDEKLTKLAKTRANQEAVA